MRDRFVLLDLFACPRHITCFAASHVLKARLTRQRWWWLHSYLHSHHPGWNEVPRVHVKCLYHKSLALYYCRSTHGCFVHKGKWGIGVWRPGKPHQSSRLFEPAAGQQSATVDLKNILDAPVETCCPRFSLHTGIDHRPSFTLIAKVWFPRWDLVPKQSRQLHASLDNPDFDYSRGTISFQPALILEISTTSSFRKGTSKSQGLYDGVLIEVIHGCHYRILLRSVNDFTNLEGDWIPTKYG